MYMLKRQISIWLLLGRNQNLSLHLGREQQIKRFFSNVVLTRLMSPRMSEELGKSSTHFLKDATITALCKALERRGVGKSQMKPGQGCETRRRKSDDDTSYWTLRLSIVFKRVKNNSLLLWCVCFYEASVWPSIRFSPLCHGGASLSHESS